MEISSSLQMAARQLLRPLVKLLLSHGVSFSEFTDWLREIFVDVAEQDFAIEGRKQTSTRISVVTGIFRKDVARIRKNIPKPTDGDKSANRAMRILGAWRRESEYLNSKGQPRVIALEGQAPSLEHLAKTFGGDVSHQAIKREFERLGIIEMSGSDKLKLIAEAYIPSKDLDQQFAFMGQATTDLLSTINHNIDHPDVSRLQLSVAYEGLSEDSLKKFKSLSETQSKELLTHLDQWLAKNIKEQKPIFEGDSKHRAGIGIYYFQEEK